MLSRFKGKRIAAVVLAAALAASCAGLFGACVKQTDTYPAKIRDAAPPENGLQDILLRIDSSTLTGIGISDGGIYYRSKDGLYGIMTFDGSCDSGPVYTEVVTAERYFRVSEKESSPQASPASLNRYGLVNARGTLLVPQEYAAVKVLNDRFATAIRVTETTKETDKAVLFSSGNMISYSYQAGCVSYLGEWEVYDLSSGRPIQGASGTQNTATQYATNDLLVFTNDDGDRVRMNAKGRVLSDFTHLLGNGSYTQSGEEEDAVFSAGGRKLFSYDPDTYLVYSIEDTDRYYAARRSSGGLKYVLLDENGEEISYAFSDTPQTVIDDTYVFVGGRLYDYEGNQLLDGTYDEIFPDNDLHRGAVLRKDNVYTFVVLMKKEDIPAPPAEDEEDEDYDEDEDEEAEEAEELQLAREIYTVTANGEYLVYPDGFYVTQDSSKGPLLYRFDTGEYRILDFSVRANWLARVGGDPGVNDLLDLYTGEKILTGYNYYSVAHLDDRTLIVLAEADDHADVFRMAV
jgi:hypothetical protein